MPYTRSYKVTMFIKTGTLVHRSHAIVATGNSKAAVKKFLLHLNVQELGHDGYEYFKKRLENKNMHFKKKFEDGETKEYSNDDGDVLFFVTRINPNSDFIYIAASEEHLDD